MRCGSRRIDFVWINRFHVSGNYTHQNIRQGLLRVGFLVLSSIECTHNTGVKTTTFRIGLSERARSDGILEYDGVCGARSMNSRMTLRRRCSWCSCSGCSWYVMGFIGCFDYSRATIKKNKSNERCKSCEQCNSLWLLLNHWFKKESET